MIDPTDEQVRALDVFHQGKSMVLEAGAGTGKTTTLRLLAYSTMARGCYLAFNKAIVTDVRGSLPNRCSASTAHSLAFRAVGRRYAHRLETPRMRGGELADRLRVTAFAYKVGDQYKTLGEGFLGGFVMRSIERFCQSADLEPGPQHVPYLDGLDMPNVLGQRTSDNNRALAQELQPAMRRAWSDICAPNGALPFKHSHYLKIWQLHHPRIPVDYILFDEAQDASPVMAAIVAEQEHAQQVYVGDAAQAIYEWTGAINALAGFETDQRAVLTQSFRFGEAIAERANVLLQQMGATLRLKGLASIPSRVGKLDERDAVLCRTNAQAIIEMLAAKKKGESPHLVGGGKDVLDFAKAAERLKGGERVYHPDLACFDTWNEVREYVSQDAQGGELRLLVDLVEEYGVETIKSALEDMPREADASLIVSTAHKAKGREWSRVQVAEDFMMTDESTPELRLRYVASTRARDHLDDTVLALGQSVQAALELPPREPKGAE